jgi:hypothetical protein
MNVNIKVLKNNDASLVAIRIQDGAKIVPSSEVAIFFNNFFFHFLENKLGNFSHMNFK